VKYLINDLPEEPGGSTPIPKFNNGHDPKPLQFTFHPVYIPKIHLNVILPSPSQSSKGIPSRRLLYAFPDSQF
jgi:hypothetical protein